MEEGKKNRLFALTVTIVVHVAILLLLLFYTLSAPVIRENDGGGVVLQLGVIDADAGTFTPTAMVSHPQPVEPEPVITQDMEETVSLDDEKPEPVVVPEESDKKVEPQPEPETSQVDDLWADALNKGGRQYCGKRRKERVAARIGRVRCIGGFSRLWRLRFGRSGVDRPSAQARVCRNER